MINRLTKYTLKKSEKYLHFWFSVHNVIGLSRHEKVSLNLFVELTCLRRDKRITLLNF